MKTTKLLSAVLFCACSCALSSAQEKGYWRAVSTTARSITGDIAFTDIKVTINFASFTIAQIHGLSFAETQTIFHAENPDGLGNLYRLSIPASKQFLHHNTLCGSDETQWIATYIAGRSLQLAFFSGEKMPIFTPEAVADATNLCGTYTYTR